MNDPDPVHKNIDRSIPSDIVSPLRPNARSNLKMVSGHLNTARY
jgi:hypothetical protein